MKIGTLNKDLVGKISTLKNEFALKLVLNTDRRSENSPTHLVIGAGHGGKDFELGGAWQKEIKQGDQTGKHLYSLSIDDLSFDRPLNCTAFPANDGFIIDFERQKAQ